MFGFTYNSFLASHSSHLHAFLMQDCKYIFKWRQFLWLSILVYFCGYWLSWIVGLCVMLVCRWYFGIYVCVTWTHSNEGFIICWLLYNLWKFDYMRYSKLPNCCCLKQPVWVFIFLFLEIHELFNELDFAFRRARTLLLNDPSLSSFRLVEQSSNNEPIPSFQHAKQAKSELQNTSSNELELELL